MSGEWLLLILVGSFAVFALGRRLKKTTFEDATGSGADPDTTYPDSSIGRTMFILDISSWLFVAFVYVVTLSLAVTYASAPYNWTISVAFLHSMLLLWYLWGALFLLSVMCWILTKAFWWGGVRTIWWFIVPSLIFTAILSDQL